MSAQATEYVWHHSPFKGTAKLVHLAVAEVVNEQHQWRYWGGDQALAAKVGCDRGTVLRWKAKAIAEGYLEEAGFDTQTGNKQYVFLMPKPMLQDATSPGQGAGDVEGSMLHPATPDVASCRSDVASTRSAPITNQTNLSKPNARSTPKLSLVVSSATFEEFWLAYPRKAGRKAAMAAWGRAVKHEPPKSIVQGAAAYRDDPNRVDEFTAHPTTWLNQGRWSDDPLPVRSQPGQAGQNADQWAALGRMMDGGMPS